jgi:methyl-accepting chemotaxis protein
MKIRATIQTKVRVSFLLIIITFLGVSILSFTKVFDLILINSKTKQSYTMLAKLEDIEQVRRDISIATRNSDSTAIIDSVSDIKKTYIENLSSLKEMIGEDKEQLQLLKTLEESQSKLFSDVEAKLKEAKSTGGDSLMKLIDEIMMPHDMNNGESGNKIKLEQFEDELIKIGDIEKSKIAEREEQMISARNVTIMALVGGSLLGVIIVIFVMILVDRSVVKNIKKTSGMLKDIAEGEGDLTKRLEIDSNDEIGDLAKSFNSFIDKIGSLVREVVDNTNVLSNSTEEVLIAIEQSNRGMSEVVHTLSRVTDNIQNSASISEEAMASIEEVAGQAHMIQGEAQNADEKGTKVLNAAIKGEGSVKEVVTAINNVKGSSKDVLGVIGELNVATNEIGQIVSMMRGITEQTSLLALNASIEAARAGEAGRGFAVVAEEVKKLSEESKQSAEQITVIVSEIQRKMQKTDSIIYQEQTYVDTSVAKVSNTSEEFNNILSYVKEMSNRIKAMTTASVQQASVTTEMSGAINLLSEGLQENAAASEEISASMESQANLYKQIEHNVENIRNITDKLKGQTNRFKL